MAEREHDKILLERIIRGDALAFDALYERYFNKVYAFSLSYLKNKEDAEGAVQEVFIILWRKREKLNEIKKLDAWLFTLTFNQVRKTFRSRSIERRNMELYSFLAEMNDESVYSTLEFNDMLENARSLINTLTPRQKNVLLLRSKEGLTSSEIAKKLGINKRTVENHLTSARSSLMALLKNENILPFVLLWILVA
jgi:RNA polymerase sigma-70 factor (ECF subfamily)